MMATREPLEWHFKQLDHAVGLSFKGTHPCSGFLKKNKKIIK